MFDDGSTSSGSVTLRTRDILLRFRTALDDAANLSNWLTAQTDAELGQPNGIGYTAQQITFLRSAVADVMAARAIIYNGLPPPAYPQPPAAHDYLVNVKQIIGPL